MADSSAPSSSWVDVVAAGVAVRALRWGIPVAMAAAAFHTYASSRAKLATDMVQLLHRDALGRFERESGACCIDPEGCLEMPAWRDFCPGEMHFDARDPRGATQLVAQSPSGATCPLHITPPSEESAMRIDYVSMMPELVTMRDVLAERHRFEDRGYEVRVRVPVLDGAVVATSQARAVEREVVVTDTVVAFEGGLVSRLSFLVHSP